MDRCVVHRRENVGVCFWCGKFLCQKCVAGQSGQKRYCEKCAGLLGVKDGH